MQEFQHPAATFEIKLGCIDNQSARHHITLTICQHVDAKHGRHELNENSIDTKNE